MRNLDAGHRRTEIYKLAATSNVRYLVLALGALAPSACSVEQPGEGSEPQPITAMPDATKATVADYTHSSGCTTAVVIGLSTQIAEEAGCENANSFVSFKGAKGLQITSNAVLPYLQKGARTDLEAAGAAETLQINSALRTLAQQYLLYEWYLQGRCGITAAATVGTSNHEGGRAVDLNNWSSRISIMSAHGWKHDVPGDVVHFDHVASPEDLGEDVKAFQTLWNRNHPSDKLGVDGEYGPETEARLKASPATGFAKGAACVTTHVATASADVVSIAGPDQALPNTVVHYDVVLQNDGDADWPASATLGLPSGTTADLQAASWPSDAVAAELPEAVPVGSQITVGLDLTMPDVTASTTIDQDFALAAAGATLGTVTIAITVSPTANPSNSGDPSEDGDMQQALTGGCNAGGGAGGWLALCAVVPAIAWSRRRKRA